MPAALPADWLGFFRFDFNGEPSLASVSQVTFVETRIAALWAITVVTFGGLTAVGAPCVVPRIVLDQSVAVRMFAKPHFFLASFRAASRSSQNPVVQTFPQAPVSASRYCSSNFLNGARAAFFA